jgi:primosomal protein N' (replication factor Y)
MPEFCDVAMPVPLDSVFTYRLNPNLPTPKIGARVLAPFRNQRLAGVVTRLHDSPPTTEAKTLLEVLDSEPTLDAGLIRLGEWIAQYYVAPLGEVFRSMLPLSADVRRVREYSITEAGREALHQSAVKGSSLRSRKSADQQQEELRVLNEVERRGTVREATLRASAKASGEIIGGLVRKKWIARQDTSHGDTVGRMQKIAVLRDVNGALKRSQKQQAILDAINAGEGRMALAELGARRLSRSALQALVRQGTIGIVEEALAERAMQSHGSHSLPRKFAEAKLNLAQQEALRQIAGAIAGRKFSVSLLHGVTGSGKTAVYLAAMQQVLAAGGSAILLVPEIGLTPAAAAHLHQLFGEQVAILHSALSAGERAQQWRRIRAGEAPMVVGTRSAIFAPVPNLALIVVDEEHDSSYKQEETPRYHGRDVAVMRGKLAGAAVVLASATPSLESYHNAEKKRYALIELRQRVEERPLPEVTVVDMREEFKKTGAEEIFSQQLAAAITDRLELGEQAIILLNRRGYSPVVLCRACGQTVQCKNCAISLIHHKQANRLECHYCGYRQAVPKICPQCKSEYIFMLGAGSEKLEERLHEVFPQARIGRLDRDTVRRRGDFERVLNAFDAGELDLLVGTQMIAKGHDIHGVTLVGVVGADFALGFPDFRAAERTFQLLTQVAGRAGRGNTPGQVILETYFPEHYAIQFAARHDYAGFCEKELRYRKWMNYPPFTAVANVLMRSPELEQALTLAGALGNWLEKNKSAGMRVMGPAAAPRVRLKKDYRYHIVLKSESRQSLNQTLRAMMRHAAEEKPSRASVVVDVDALSLL